MNLNGKPFPTSSTYTKGDSIFEAGTINDGVVILDETSTALLDGAVQIDVTQNILGDPQTMGGLQTRFWMNQDVAKP